MRERKKLIAEVLFILCLVVVYDQLMGTDPMEITLDSGESFALAGSAFTFYDTLLLVVVSFIGGASFAYLFIGEDTEIAAGAPSESGWDITQLLPADERTLYVKLAKNDGSMLQKDLVAELPFGSVKTSRLITRLEKKGIVVRYKHGMTNRVALK